MEQLASGRVDWNRLPARSSVATTQLLRLRFRRFRLHRLSCFLFCCFQALCAGPLEAGSLDRIRAAGRLVYGSDQEGGGPYAYADPQHPERLIGFEVDMMSRLATDLGVRAEFAQGQWDRLLQQLDTGRIDCVANGCEWTPVRARNYLATRPYYVYQLQLMARRGGEVRSWEQIATAARGFRVGVLANSAADAFARTQGGPRIEVVSFDGAVDAMTATLNGQIDATLQDLPATIFYRSRFEGLEFAGPPVGRGYYVVFVPKRDRDLKDALDAALVRMTASGELRRILEHYSIWNDEQVALSSWNAAEFERLEAADEAPTRGWRLVLLSSRLLLAAAGMTLLLSIVSMPLAMAIGLAVALGRLYAPRVVQILLSAYVELLRGTPLMLQLYVLYYVLKLPAFVAGVAGLAINYSAYESEIYRAGLQSIPVGQMEAALALGMSRRQALRRIVIPQATRVVIPPVTNDFIAMFKDTSVCSVITIVELTKQYSFLANNTGGLVEAAVATAALYLAMSLPLAWFSRRSERRLGVATGMRGVPT